MPVVLACLRAAILARPLQWWPTSECSRLKSPGVSETLPGQSVMGTSMDQMLLTFVWIGLGMGTGKFIYISCVNYVCSASVLKYKKSFLKAVLR